MGVLILVQFAQGQTVDEVIDKYTAARGGLHNLLGIQSIFMQGTRQMMESEIKVTVTKEQGKLSRTEFEMEAGNGFVLLTDKEGWNMFFMQSPNPIKMPDDVVSDQQTELDIAGPLVDYLAKGHKVELMGKETLDDVVCYKIRLTTTAGKDIRYWIDADTYLLVQSAVKVKGNYFGLGGDKNLAVAAAPVQEEVLTLYGDYNAVDGILFPYTVVTKIPSAQQSGNSTTYDKIELNITVDTQLYKPE